VKSTQLRQLKKRLARNNQKGFTLIELLVVISILGILAAVVTMSLVGVEGAARQRAQDAELSTVQTAFDTDVQQHQIDADTACTALGSGLRVSQMTGWPGNNPGEALYPNYLHQSNGDQFKYTCKDHTSATLQNS
jgi:prepilin-type N-terminal cleavage/methylation domain-containing protein